MWGVRAFKLPLGSASSFMDGDMASTLTPLGAVEPTVAVGIGGFEGGSVRLALTPKTATPVAPAQPQSLLSVRC